MNRARSGRVADPTPIQPHQAGSDMLESSYQRGKVSPDEGSFFANLRHKTVNYLRETFIPSQELKGSDKVTTDGTGRTRFFGKAIDYIRTAHSDPRNAREKARKLVKSMFSSLTPDEYDLTKRYIFMRDAHENILRGMESRPGFDPVSVSTEINRLQDLVDKSPDVQQTLDSYKTLMNSVRDLGIEEGLMHKVDRDWYFPHTVLDFTDLLSKNSKILGITVPRFSAGGNKWRQPGNFRERLGSARDISTNLADQTENYIADVYTQITRRQRLNELGQIYDVRNNPNYKDKLGNTVAYVEEGGQVPPGFVKWDPNRIQSLYRLRGSSMSERYLGEMIDYGGLDALAEHLKLDPIEFRQALGEVGIANPEEIAAKLGASLLPEEGHHVYTIPEELARTLTKSVDLMNRAESMGLSEQLTRRWKSVVLNMAPIRYNFRNFIGDFQRMYAQFGGEVIDGKRWSRVTKSVHDYYSKGLIDDLMQQMLDHGISSSGRIQSEYMISRIDPQLRMLEHGVEQSNLKKASNTLWKVLEYLPEKSSIREDIVRGVLLDMNNTRLAEGKPLLHGVADPELVQGLMDRGEARRASSYIARKSLLDYGDFTPTENKWRNGWMPFYSWASGNFQFWSVLGKNLAKAPSAPTAAPAVRASTMAALKGAAGMGVVYATVHAWNDLVMGDWEERLPQNVQKQLHFILPDIDHWQKTGEYKPAFDDEGRVKYWNTPDALDDFLTYLGVDHMMPETMSLMRGTLSKEEWARRNREHFGWMGGAIPKGPVRTVLGGLGPVQQLGAQIGLGKRMFPDPLNPTDIAPDQRMSALRDVLGFSAIPGVEGAFGAMGEGADLFQPATKMFDIPKQLGMGAAREPTILMNGQLLDPSRPGVTRYEADLIRQIGRKQQEFTKLQGDLKREYSLQSNRQLDESVRQERFKGRRLEMDQLIAEMQDLANRYRNLQRTHRFQSTHP